MKIDLTRFRETFFDEAAEHLATMEAGLLRLESAPDDRGLLNEVFRAAHSLKGGSTTLGLGEITALTHAMEGLLDLLRAGTVRARPALIDLLLRGRDGAAGLVQAARANQPAPPGLAALRDELAAALDAARHRAAAPPAEPLSTFAILFLPSRDFFRRGMDPLPILRELAALGTIVQLRPNLTQLPPLPQLDAEACYLSWSFLLKTDRPREAVEEVFEFARDCCELTLTPLSEPAPSPPPLDRVRPAFFGTFLVERGLATAEQVLKAIDWQARSRPLIGRVALQTGKMSVEQVFDTLNRMPTIGKRFGEVALESGYLTEGDLAELLRLQQQTRPLGELLVEAGALSAAQLRAALEAFGHHADAHVLDDPDASADAVAPLSSPESFAPANPELLDGFCAEADEHLEAVDRDLLALDANPTCKETLNAVYRAFHSIKGVASMFDLKAIVSLAHEAENLLNCARDGTVELSGKALDLAFASADALRRQVGYVRAWMAGGGGQLEVDAGLPALVGLLRAALPGARPAAHPERPPAPAPAEPPPEADRAAEPRQAAAEKETVRVDRGRLDKLINAIGELVIAQSMVQQELDEQLRHAGFHSRALPELCKIARDLQELSLSLRMVPLQGTFQKIARVVRDLSKKIAKPVHFHMHGEDTELDKTVVDRLGDPLVHMVRNAVDHGIEPAEARVAAGKPAEGSVTLRAFHQGGNVHIELTDDGKGLDRQAILAKALERGLVQEGASLTDAEVFGLIFEAGFSTAKVVTDVSGRGVGMDVVRRNVEALQGSIHIRSQPGKGTTFTVRLPLTLAIMDGLSVSLLDDVYILPLLSVIESFQPRPGDVHTVAGSGEVVVVRGEAVPLLRLHRLLCRPARVTDPRNGLVVLVENQGQKFALLVDELLGQLQVVMKSLDVNFHKVEGLAGATILGDGRVAMILDVYGLTRLAQPRGRAANELAIA